MRLNAALADALVSLKRREVLRVRAPYLWPNKHGGVKATLACLDGPASSPEPQRLLDLRSRSEGRISDRKQI